ncbi:MAG TPA: hypothetical protein VLG15_08185 [Thermoanaerobaculia bacterium]|nr:hypothetical protein [Thermoanaerobaculia bacterium]
MGRVTLRTPGLTGEATARVAGADGMRAAEIATTQLETALANTNVSRQETVEISGTQEVPVGGISTRSAPTGEPAIVLEAPDPGAESGQFVLYTDESGVTTWHLPRDEFNDVAVTRGGATRTYLIPRTVAAAPSVQPEIRGIVGAIGKKILQVLVFPIIAPVVGRVGEFLVREWEEKKRPYRFRSFTPANYQNAGSPLGAGDWASLAKGPCLLLVHGTFSRTDAAFGDLPRPYVQDLCRLYDDRVFSFDHPTLSEDPDQNASRFVENLPVDLRLQLDIVCHSRGGLVSRVLAERQGALPMANRTLTFRKMVFVATPNGGTVLTDTRHVGDFIDTYTNLLNFFPSAGVIDVLEAIITVVKQLALATAKSLCGLQSMLPGGDFLTSLNQGPKDAKKYYALASNFEPTHPGLKAFAQNRLIDAIFQKADNDLVVPTAGVYEKNGSDFFPIPAARRLVFSGLAGIPHSGFFANEAARRKILGWLSAGMSEGRSSPS